MCQVVKEGLLEEKKIVKMEKEQHQFELDELEAHMEDISTKLRKKEQHVAELQSKIKEFEKMLDSR